MRQRRFHDCSLRENLLYTGLLALIGLSYLMAMTYLYT